MLASAALLPATTAQAQSAPTREELRPGDVLRDRPAQPSRLTVDGDIERGPCPLAAPSLAGTTVSFSQVTFANLDAVPPATLDPAWRDFAGREVPVASLCEVRDRAATILRAMGYLAAVQIPPQRIDKGGEVRMDVLIARLSEVQVRGDPGRSEKLIAAHLRKLTAEPYFNIKRAERHLLLLSDLPGFDVRLTLKPARGAPGEVIGDVLVKRQPIQLSTGFQNLGSKASGREGAFVQVLLNDLTGSGDRTMLSVFNTLDIEEQTVFQLEHDFAAGPSGLRIGGHFLYARGEPDTGSANFRTETVGTGLELSYPVRRTQALSLYAKGGFEAIRQRVDLGSTPLTEDNLRTVYGRLDLAMTDKGSLTGKGGYSANEPKWRIGASLEARQGLGILGASKDCSPITNCTAPNVPISNLLADPSPFVVRAEARLEYRPVTDLTLTMAPRLQYSDDILLSYERYSLGNYTIGRGLDPGTVLGDSGLGSAFEIAYGSLMPRGPDAVAIQPYAFLDTAWAWNNDGGLTGDPQRVTTAGGGVRARWGSHIDANLLLAAPLRRSGTQTEKGDLRVLFTIRARLVPWDPS